MAKKLAKIVTLLFHPVLIPTLGLFLFFNSGFYFTLLSWEAKRYIILVILFTTGVLPLLSVAIMALRGCSIINYSIL
ncbi:MAG: hypothetical protein J7L95_08215, partial [Prolixibacteraceae bacterium]|nr:hypothetical protein [Prolixibacteraceae bacterium]